MAHPCHVCNYYPVPDGEGVECPHCHRLQYGNQCPRCGQNAPTIVRGLQVYCSVCNQVRGPLSSGMPLNVVGQPSRVGGTVTRVAGYGVWFGAVIMALTVAVILGLLAGATYALVGALIPLFVGGTIGTLMLMGGRKLQEHGDVAQRHAREQALYALAARRGGMITASDAAAALNVQLAEADALLTSMAREAQHVSVEVDANGTVQYLFSEQRLLQQPGAAMPPSIRMEPTGVRVDARAAPQAGAPAQAEAEGVDQERIRANVDREFERMRALNQNKRGS